MKKTNYSLLLLMLLINGIISSQTLLTPVTNSKTFNPFPHFTWSINANSSNSTQNLFYYEIAIASDEEFKKIIDTDTIYSNRYVNDSPLKPGDYYWKIRTCTKNTNGKWSSPAHFKITPCDEIVTVQYSTNVNDHYNAVQQAISRAKILVENGKSVQIEFPKGNYKFDKVRSALLSISNTRNIIVNGNGSTIQSLRYNGGLSQLSNVENIIITGFNIEFPNEKTFLQGWVKAVDNEEGIITVKLDKDFDDYDNAYIKQGADAVSILDPNINGRLKTNAYNYFPIQSITSVDNGCWNLKLVKKLMINDFSVGDRFVHVIRKNSIGLNSIYNSNNVVFHNITSYGASSIHYGAFDSSLLNILHCKWKIANGQWYSGNADGIHCRGFKIGPWIEGCEINSIGDDGIALYARPATINNTKPSIDSNTLLLNKNYMNLENGDEVAFFDPEQGKIILEANVTSVQPSSDNNLWEVKFSKKIPDNITPSNSDIVHCTQIWNRSKSCGDFVIRKNEISNIRRYGAVFRAQKGVLERNIFHGVSNSAIIAVNEPFWPNGLYSSDIIIKNNKLYDNAFEKDHTLPITFNFQSHSYVNPPLVGPNYKPAIDLGHRRILIEKNEFDCSKEKNILLVSTQDVIIRDNTINKSTTECNQNSVEIEQYNSKNIIEN